VKRIIIVVNVVLLLKFRVFLKSVSLLFVPRLVRESRPRAFQRNDPASATIYFTLFNTSINISASH